MKRQHLMLCIALLSILTLLLHSSAHAATFTAFGPKIFARGSGKPVVETTSFSIKNPNTSYIIKVYNGGMNFECSRVSSALITLNGSVVFYTNDFNRQESTLQKQVSVSNTNQLQVELRSAPGSGLTIIIEGEDSDPPSVTIISPVNGLYTNIPSAAVDGSASDATSWVSNVTVNGTTASLTGETYISNIQLTEGRNTITARATDAAGNESNASISVILDTILPTITLDTVPSMTNKSNLTITGTASDEGSGISKITINNTTAQINGNSYTASIQLTEGQNTISVTTKDNAGNITVQTVTITLDTTPPAISITSPLNGSTVNSSTIAVVGTIDDSTATVTVNSISANVSNNAFSADISLGQGTNTVNVIATDPVGNTSTAAVSITYAVQSPVPVITITSPSDGSTVKTTSVLVFGTVDDPAAIVRINGNTVAVMDSGESIERESPLPEPIFHDEPQVPGVPSENQTYTFASYVDLVEGLNQITVTATNASGKTTSTSLTITRSTLDVPPPVISVKSPADGSTVTSSFISLFGFISDPFSKLSIISDTAYIDHSYSYINGNSFYYMARVIPGKNTITITATNSAGKIATTSVTITYTLPPLQINITSPANSLIVNTDTVTVSANIYRTINPIATVTINGVNAALNQIDYNNYTMTSSMLLTEGANTITVVATDTTGLSSNSSITVYLDSIPPVVLSTIPAFNDVGIHIDSPITINLSEPVNNATATTFTLSSATTGQISGRITGNGNAVTFTPYSKLSPNTVYTAVIKGGSSGVKDLAGNAMTSDYAWVFKTGDPPVLVEITEPNNWGIISGTVALIKGSIKSYSRDISVKVNGIVAEINGANWAAMVPMKTGWNAIEVNAFDGSGNTNKKTIYIYDYNNEQLATITPNPKSGIAPLSVTFSIGNSSSITSYLKFDFDGDGAIDLETSDREGMTYTYNLPGLYFPSVSYIDKWGYTKKITTVVNALSKEEIDSLLKGKWDVMKGAMGSGDIDTAIMAFESTSQKNYRAQFTALKSALNEISIDMGQINLVKIEDGRAEYEIIAVRNGVTYSFYLLLVKDENGLWKIKEF